MVTEQQVRKAQIAKALVAKARNVGHMSDEQILKLASFSQRETRQALWWLDEDSRPYVGRDGERTCEEHAQHRAMFPVLDDGRFGVDSLKEEVRKACNYGAYSVYKMTGNFTELVGLPGRWERDYDIAEWLIRQILDSDRLRASGDLQLLLREKLELNFTVREDERTSDQYRAVAFVLGDPVQTDDVVGRVLAESALTGLALLAALVQSPRFAIDVAREIHGRIAVPGIIVRRGDCGHMLVVCGEGVDDETGRARIRIYLVGTNAPEHYRMGLRVPCCLNLPVGLGDPTVDW